MTRTEAEALLTKWGWTHAEDGWHAPEPNQYAFLTDVDIERVETRPETKPDFVHIVTKLGREAGVAIGSIDVLPSKTGGCC